MNSKAKGARGEREWAHYLRDNFGLEARRGQQYSGSPDSPDVVCNDGHHYEVKRTETLSIYKAMDQAVRDAHPDKIPTVVFRKNGEEWLVIMRAVDFGRIKK